MKIKSSSKIQELHLKQIKEVETTTSIYMIYQLGVLEGQKDTENKTGESLQSIGSKPCEKCGGNYISCKCNTIDGRK